MSNSTRKHQRCQKISDSPTDSFFEQLCLPIPGFLNDSANQKEKTKISKRPLELIAENSCSTQRAGQLVGVCANTLRKARKKSKVYVHKNWKAEYLGRNSWRIWLNPASQKQKSN